MKIRILTQPLGLNIGGILQNYALMKTCLKFSHDVKTLDIAYSPHFFALLIKYGACLKRLFVKIFLNRKITVRWWLEKKIDIPQNNAKISLNSHKSLRKMNLSETSFVFGSDQIWRKEMSPNIMSFFGSFLKDSTPRIAYAASFGVDYWQFDEDETKKIIPLLKKFKAISVREESAVDLLAKRGIQAQLALDPTLLLRPEEYVCLETVVSRQFAAKPHIFLYCLDKHPLQDKATSSVSKKKKMPIMNIIENLQIDNWISSLRTAEYVVTDSFHGTAFSILLHKKFIVVANKERGLPRLQSLLKIFHLENRLIMSFDDFNCEKLDAEIDYESVDIILNREREKSLAFLRKNLS